MFRMAIFGFSNDFGYCSKPAYEKDFLKQTPLTMNESVTDPPVIFLIPISLFYKSSSKYKTASTTISEKNSLYLEIILEFNEVYEHLIRRSLFSSGLLSAILTEISLILSMHWLQASLYPLMIIWECMPSSMNCFDYFKSSPAVRTTEVVPSPTSLS